MLSSSTEIPTPGQLVRVRQRRYLVDDRVEPLNSGDSTLVRLSCVDDDAQGQSIEVLWERELDGEILNAEAWDKIAERGFDPPRQFAAYLHTLRWNCVTSTDPGLLQSPFRAGIRLDPYQLEPLRKALRLPRVNLFIADDVGLGKTIEAGLIARELIMRKKVHEIVVACPPSMLQQWQEELENRFGLQFQILDKDYVQKLRRERGFGVDPWTTHPHFLVSHRLLIDENYASGLREHLSTFLPGSLLILDEAHHAAPSSGQGYAIDSQTTRAIRDLAPRFEHRLFLSATPHNGHSNSFSALLEILDPQRFFRGVKVNPTNLNTVMVRRLKEDLREITGGFPVRHIEQITIAGLPSDAPELRLASLLDEYRQLREERLKGESKRIQASSGLLLSGLQQRLFSSVEAFARTLNVHRKTVLRQREGVLASFAKTDLLNSPPDADEDRATLPFSELVEEEEAQIAAVTEATRGFVPEPSLFEKEQKFLEQMSSIANAYRGLPDARVARLLEWIEANQCPGFSNGGSEWTSTRVLIFTEYTDTERYLRQQLSGAIANTDRADERIRVFSGVTSPADREEIKAAFNADPAQHPVRILIATDAAREGLNLQAHCSHLFHFDVPWNPSRMEQRNGRIDRKLQPSADVFCYYFYYAQRPEDRVLAALVRKTDTIRKELGSLAQVIDSQLGELMKKGIHRESVSSLEQTIERTDLEQDHRANIEEEFESTRVRKQELVEEIDKLRDMLDRSKRHLGLSEDQFRSAISQSLIMQGAPPLVETAHNQFQFPPIEANTWATTMDSLRAPRSREQRFYEWRREAPIRPVVFQDPGIVTDEVVQLHLEHRVVQRLLSRFLSQGFTEFDLSRACLAQYRDSIPRVILIGRLSLYGPNAARLHEELVPVTARWIDPLIRKTTLSPYARETETRTLAMLDEALISVDSRPVAAPQADKLRQAAGHDVRELLPHLEARAAEYGRDAEAKLAQRSNAEGKAMREVLETQRRDIERTTRQWAQRSFAFEEENRQLESERRDWGQRLIRIEEELETEPARIAELYKIRARRTEPVGLVYLWPVS